MVAAQFVLGFAVILLTSGHPLPLAAQDLGTDCTLTSYGTLQSEDMGAGRRVTWLARPFMVCPNGTRIRSDSAVVYEETGRAELIGRVDFQTPERHLQSQFADYFEREDRLFARGSVVFRDRARGSVVEGDTLVYLAANEFRPEDQVTVSGGRPRATLPPPAERPESEDYRVTGNTLRFAGEQFFWADGAVEVVRGDLEAFADSLAFDQRGGQLFLNRDARVLAEGTEMTANRISLSIPDDVLESVTLRERGRVITENQDLTGEEIRITLIDEEIQHIVAVHRPTAEGEEEPPAPRVVADDFIMRADSLEIITPEQVLERVIAVGGARVESRAGIGTEDEGEVPDRLDPESLPAALRGMIDRDWIEGAEVLAFFEPVPDMEETDPLDPEAVESGNGGTRVRLLRLEARGNARTLYRSPPDTANGARPQDAADAPEPRGATRRPISYIVAEEILIYFVDGALDRLEAIEQVIGIQLEPTDRSGDTGAGRDAPGPVDPPDEPEENWWRL
jgi:hypothetical protein